MKYSAIKRGRPKKYPLELLQIPGDSFVYECTGDKNSIANSIRTASYRRAMHVSCNVCDEGVIVTLRGVI
jgi:hypothetical protein